MGQRLDGQLQFAEEIRAVEQSLADIHYELVEWGLWGRNGSLLDHHKAAMHPRVDIRIGVPQDPSVWRLPGKHDPGTDEEATPESPPPPINIRRVRELDSIICAADFAAVWRKVLKANYILKLPEWQRPAWADVSPNVFLISLESALEHLTNQ